jgi:hypothetical protein
VSLHVKLVERSPSMEDVTNPTSGISGAAPAGGEVKPTGDVATPSSVTPPSTQTAVTDNEPVTPVKPVTNTVPERTVPLGVLQKERAKFREAQRELARLKGQSQLQGYDPAETDKVLQHPLVQKLLIDNAKTQVTDFAKETLEQYPEFPAIVKKAILKNVRGFINEETTDPETAKEDVRQYIEDIWAEVQAEKAAKAPISPITPITPKGPVVSPTNAGGLPQAAAVRPKEIEAILQKPVTEWTDEDNAKMSAYSEKH